MNETTPHRPAPHPRSEREEPESGTVDNPVDTVDNTEAPDARRRRLRAALAALAVVAALGGAGVFGYQHFSLRADQAARQEALAAAERFAASLSSYDFQDLERNFRGVTEHATDRFAQQYRQVGDNLTKLIEEHEAVSKGEVLAAGVVAGDRDSAVVLLFVDQTISNTNSPQPRVDRNRMRMTLVHRDDRWLVDDVTLL
ncbi:Mce-associated membrane protein [Prauserella shujinwangii]|uniref:Mce-associated membrane protein n=1 Tax=Prauserella shujinwangii TaxID=1453103 RepID=A0A2T0LQ74_9PSEU|nr:hypothetical protein [Prauserella shujinwangii]PRX45412.1 Mce-associated membrane protein [Prauserella shujinwangii]